jgi:PAS domain S-box-containing protein
MTMKNPSAVNVQNDLFRNIQQLPVATAVIVDNGSKLAEVNDAFLGVFNKDGLPQTDDQGYNLFPELGHPLISQAISNAMQLGISVKEIGVQVNISSSAGTEQKYLDCYAAPVIDENNQVTTNIILTILDRNPVKSSQRRSIERDRTYRSLVESMGVAVYTCDTEGRINYYNDAALTLWGRKPELGVELWCGSHKMFTLDGSWMPHDQCPAAVSLKERRAVEAEALVQRPDGKIRQVLVFPRPEYNAEGQLIGLINAVVDITDRKALERQKDDFMGIVAHELRTPVTSLRGYAQLLTKRLAKLADEKAIHMQSRFEFQLNSLTKLIDRMLSVAKIESGDLTFEKKQFDLVSLVGETLETVQSSTTTHRLILVPGNSVFAEGDREHISQVIINLLSNAIKYSPKADRVIVSVSALENKAIFTVRDFGFGIPAGETTCLFEKFYRVKDEHVNRLPGIGLGLYLSAEIIRQHGGEIWVESVLNEGSIFSFSLPLKKG